MHRVFVSEGIVFGKRGVGEENTLITIFTKEFGLIRASARAGRRENSKLRYGLEALTRAKFSFIRGKYEWKITGALDVSHELFSPEPLSRQAIGRVVRLLSRIMSREEPQPALYTSVSEGLRALARGVDVEAVLVLRVLSHLGYLPATPELEPFIEQDFFSIELAREAAASKALLIKAINESLSATGL